MSCEAPDDEADGEAAGADEPPKGEAHCGIAKRLLVGVLDGVFLAGALSSSSL